MQTDHSIRHANPETDLLFRQPEGTVYSFDLFDTVLSRKTGTPKGIFCMMRKTLETWRELEKEFVLHFSEIRIQAETSARETVAGEEISLDDIYRAMKKLHPGIPEEKIARLEMDLERSSSFGIREIIETIHRLLDAGKRVVFISDMYLPSALIREMLEKASPRLSSLPVYLSSEQGVAKRSGNLFRRVLEKEHLAPEDLLHTGDDSRADIRIPGELGIRTCHFTGSALLEPEKIMLHREDDLYAQLMCGASRFTRLTSEDRSDAFRTAATFSGPLFYTCVFPVLERAANTKNALVHFMARDGNVLKIIADEILSVHPLPVRTNYFHASRETLLFPSLRNCSGTLFSVLKQRRFLDSCETLHSLSGKFFLPESSIRDFAEQNRIRPDQAMSEKMLKKFFTFLSRNGGLRNLREEGEKSRNLFLEYLKESGFFHASNFVVDIGWFGKSLTALRELLDNIPVSCENILCFGDAREQQAPEIEILTPLTPDEQYRFNPCLELFCRADHGKTTGYERRDGKIHPLLSPLPAGYLTWPFRSYRSGLREFARNFTVLLSDFQPGRKEQEPALRRALLDLLTKPPLYVAETGGSILSVPGDPGVSGTEAAPPFTCTSLMQYLFTRNAGISIWYEGSLARSDFLFIRLHASFFLFLRKIANGFIWLKRDGLSATVREAIRQFKATRRK